MFRVLIPIVILSFLLRDWVIKFFRIPKIFDYKISILIKTFITSPGSSCIFSLASSVAVRSFVLPSSTSLPTGSNSPSNDRLTGSFCYFQNSVLCAGVKQYNRATLTGNNIRVACFIQQLNITTLIIIRVRELHRKRQFTNHLNILIHKVLSQTFRRLPTDYWFVLCSKSCIIMPSIKLTFTISSVLH